MSHSCHELEAEDLLELTSFLLIEEIEATSIDELSGDLEGNLILPLVDLRHGEVIKEDSKLLVLEGTEDLGVLLLDFRLNRLLEVVGLSVEREVDSLEGEFLLVEAGSVHQDDGCLGSTLTTNDESVKKTWLLSAL